MGDTNEPEYPPPTTIEDEIDEILGRIEGEQA